MFTVYVRNCFWLIVPILMLNILLARRLPTLYQPEVFDDVPKWISGTENILRILVLLAPVLMPLEATNEGQRLGLALYVVGLAAYVASWLLQIGLPESRWSLSRLGFMAPAYTPIVWLAGISLIGQSLFLPLHWSPRIYALLGSGFLFFHNLHCWIAYSRSKEKTHYGGTYC